MWLRLNYNYYPFGSVAKGRSFSSQSYRYGFNGKENDPETVGTGQGTQDYGMRIYNPALGRFLSVDPLSQSFPMLSSYQFASNMPIRAIDLDGLEASMRPIYGEKGEIIKIQVVVAIQVDNKSSYSKDQINGYVAAISKQITDSYKGTVKYNGVEVPVEASTYVTPAEEDSPFTITFKDVGTDYAKEEGVLAETSKIGKTQNNHIDVYLGAGQDAVNDVGITGTHELGHALGLTHTDLPQNLMNPYDDGSGKQTDVTQKQLQKIVNKVEKQQPELPTDNRSVEEVEAGEPMKED